MKTITIGLAALLLSTAASFAADAWKEAESVAPRSTPMPWA